MRYDTSQKGRHCAKFNGMKKIAIAKSYESKQTDSVDETPNIVTNFGS
jgi:hypothetical protein